MTTALRITTVATFIACASGLPCRAAADSTPHLDGMRVTMAETRLVFSVKVDDPAGRIQTITLHFRAHDTSYREKTMIRDGAAARVEIEREELLANSKSLKLLYYATAHGTDQRVVASFRTNEDPSVLFVAMIFDPAQLGSSAAEAASSDEPERKAEPPMPRSNQTEAIPAQPISPEPADQYEVVGFWTWVVAAAAIVVVGGGVTTYLTFSDR